MRRFFLPSLVATAWLQTATAGGAAPVLKSTIPEAEVTVGFPASAPNVGDKRRFTVMVTPAAGQSPPSAVRGRFGMPDHGHWVGDEQTNPYRDQEMTFDAEFPMPGVYRLRIWLDYADGRETRTAVDFTVEENKSLDPKIVP